MPTDMEYEYNRPWSGGFAPGSIVRAFGDEYIIPLPHMHEFPSQYRRFQARYPTRPHGYVLLYTVNPPHVYAGCCEVREVTVVRDGPGRTMTVEEIEAKRLPRVESLGTFEFRKVRGMWELHVQSTVAEQIAKVGKMGCWQERNPGARLGWRILKHSGEAAVLPHEHGSTMFFAVGPAPPTSVWLLPGEAVLRYHGPVTQSRVQYVIDSFKENSTYWWEQLFEQNKRYVDDLRRYTPITETPPPAPAPEPRTNNDARYHAYATESTWTQRFTWPGEQTLYVQALPTSAVSREMYENLLRSLEQQSRELLVEQSRPVTWEFDE